ncbi:DUF2339 domain-containing protein [Paenibacillus lycopersici]|uniref:DUF2339 domain-containing protein n=1 Tax=Paenibacillus lycopersici TaxID=2704462 RepID=A0A6C0G594_9BACL|nr:DUF2339 domain-containing protein [Paenibacillus lycopersici]QHT62714.1 DUF2339 domain-containing protein [Paenibacillus lycopersici]
MNDLWKRHWTTLIGVLFLLAALATLFKYTIDQGLITLPMKLGIGLLAGGAAVAAGLNAVRRPEAARSRLGEIATGLGAAIWYTTGMYAGVYEAVWEPLTVFIVMTAMTAALTAFAYRRNFRLLLGLGLGGALLAPFVLQPEADHVFPLFLYLLVVNAAYFAIGIAKSWLEPRIGAFAATWILYAVYYMNFSHPDSGWLTKPAGYALAAFAFYALAFFAAAWREKCGFAGWNMTAGFANTVIFCLWAPALLGSGHAVTMLLLAVGMLYMAMSAAVARIGKHRKQGNQARTAVYSHLLFGAFMFLIGLAELGGGSEYRPVIGACVWSVVAALAAAVGMKVRSDLMKAAASLIWLFTVIYWFATAWDVPPINWFDVYVPFLNGGAAAWMLLAAIGFGFARTIRFDRIRPESDNIVIGHIYALLSHLIVGGLLTVQIMNASDAYVWADGPMLMLSVTWGVYALLLFAWGGYSRGRLFRWFGSAVLAVVAAKTLLFDLSGEDTLYKIIAFAALGLICFGITLIDRRWRNREQNSAGADSGGAAVTSPGERTDDANSPERQAASATPASAAEEDPANGATP